jgi:hypothetical protein
MWYKENDCKYELQEHSFSIITPIHTALSTREFLAKHSIPILSQLPYLLDISASFFYPVPQIKIT